jgi:hypothetical protein
MHFRLAIMHMQASISRRDLSFFVILTTGALATGGMDLGQLRVSEAGSGFEIAQRS